MPKNPEDSKGIPRIKIEYPLIGNSETGNVAGVTGVFGELPSEILVFANPAIGTVALKAGVFGYGHGNGVQGHSSSPTDSGVWGHNSHGGYGVTGTSDKPNGIGVFGRGEALAGKFEGKVEITENLTVHGIDLIERINQLENVISNLTNHVIPKPAINLLDTGYHVSVSGYGFTPLSLIEIRKSYHWNNTFTTTGANNPTVVKADINGDFAEIEFELSGGLEVVHINVGATDIASGVTANASLRDR
jgi:hypothetical protein